MPTNGNNPSISFVDENNKANIMLPISTGYILSTNERKYALKVVNDYFSKSGIKDINYILDIPEVEALVGEAGYKTKTFCKLFMPEAFWREFDSPYEEIFEALDDFTLNKVAIMGPRGIGKTTLFTIVTSLRYSLYTHTNFIVPILSTKEDAILRSEEIKDAFKAYPRLTHFFGSQQTTNYSKQIWETEYGVGFLPRSPGQQVRGIRFRGKRPGLILLDDVEREGVSPSQRRKLRSWCNNAVFNAVDVYERPPTWRILMVGTKLNDDGPLATAFKSNSFEKIHIKLWRKNFVSNFPNAISTEEIKSKVEDAKETGELKNLYREFQGILHDEEELSFKEHHFNEYSETDPEFIRRKDKLETWVLCDPARTTKDESADSAIITVSFDSELSRVYFRRAFNEKIKPDAVLSEIISQSMFYGTRNFGLETEGLEEWILQPFKDMLFIKHGIIPNIKVLPTRGGNGETRLGEKTKIARVWGLLPYAKNGNLYFNNSGTQSLKEQLLDMPDSNPIDLADIASQVLFLFALRILPFNRRHLDANGLPIKDVSIDAAIAEHYAKRKNSKGLQNIRDMGREGRVSIKESYRRFRKSKRIH